MIEPICLNVLCAWLLPDPPFIDVLCFQNEHLLHDLHSCRIMLSIYTFSYLLGFLLSQVTYHFCDTIIWLLLFDVHLVVLLTNLIDLRCSILHLTYSSIDLTIERYAISRSSCALREESKFSREMVYCTHPFTGELLSLSHRKQAWGCSEYQGIPTKVFLYCGTPFSTEVRVALREESSLTNVILWYKLLASILSAVCNVIQPS